MQTLDRVAADTTAADNRVVLAGFLEDIKANTGKKELGLLLVDKVPFTFNPSLPRRSFSDTVLLDVCHNHQIINIEKLSQLTSV